MTIVRTDAAAFATLRGDASAHRLGDALLGDAGVASIVLGLVASQLVIGLLALILLSR